jgi:hypothetical protein
MMMSLDAIMIGPDRPAGRFILKHACSCSLRAAATVLTRPLCHRRGPPSTLRATAAAPTRPLHLIATPIHLGNCVLLFHAASPFAYR